MERLLKSDIRLKSAASTDHSVFGGIIGGQVAGLIMAVVVMVVFALFLGKPLYYPVQVIGSTVFGESALLGFHPGAFFAGLVLHQAGPSLLWGLVFGLLAKKFRVSSIESSLGYGIAIGVVAMVGPYILIPAMMNALHGVDIWNREVPLLWDWAAHIVFGASFAFYPYIAKKIQK